MSATNPPESTSADSRAAKRQKVTRACDSCKSRKRRCTGELPCRSCVSSGIECTYNASYTRGRIVEPVRASYSPTTGGRASSATVKSYDYGSSTKEVEPADGTSSNSKPSRAASPEGDPAALAGQYSGPSSAYSFLRRAWRRFGLQSHQKEDAELNQTVSIFHYGDRQLPAGCESRPFALPDQQVTLELFSIYFDFAMPTYRFLHRPTVYQWRQAYHDNPSSLLPARQAVVLMVLATAVFLKTDVGSGVDVVENWKASEPFFEEAQRRLHAESGQVRIESVQARLAMILYLLHTSRPNQAWYTFGITTQLILALGMHRARAEGAPQLDTVTAECRKRAFWTAHGLDTWLSCILGRPALIHSDEIDQDFPSAIDDEEMEPNGITSSSLQRDPVIQGSIFHAKATCIVKKALKEQYSVRRHKESHRLDAVSRLNAELGAWKASLPVILSGEIHPSSLIQIFQRQIIMLQLVHSLALILINRPLLLTESTGENMKSHLTTCLLAAKSVLDTVIGFISDRKMFEAFYFTQYVTFNALSIVYIWLIQRQRGRLKNLTLPYADDDLYQLAQTIQKYMSNATAANAPSLKYNIVLEELHQETKRQMAKSSKARPPHVSGLIEPPTQSHPYATPLNPSESSPSSQNAASMAWDSVSGDFPLDNDLWLQLDSYPFSDFDFQQFT